MATGRDWNHNKTCVLYLLIHSTNACKCLLQADVEDTVKNKKDSAPDLMELIM